MNQLAVTAPPNFRLLDPTLHPLPTQSILYHHHPMLQQQQGQQSVHQQAHRQFHHNPMPMMEQHQLQLPKMQPGGYGYLPPLFGHGHESADFTFSPCQPSMNREYQQSIHQHQWQGQTREYFPQHQQQQQPHPFPLAVAVVGVGGDSGFPHQESFHRHSRWLPLHTRRPPTFPVNMARPSNGMTEEELAHLQKLSNEYEPESTGPLVGQRVPSSQITIEYATADPVFQAKTAALPLKFSHYRKVRGDGKCGWRSVAFGYFETLINLGDVRRFLEEESRLRSLNNVLNAAGYDLMLYEDFSDVTIELLRNVGIAHQEAKDNRVILIDAFNDDYLQNFIITYFKTLTSAWMKTHSNDYAPWVLNQTVEQYCDLVVMPMNTEIDDVSLSALRDVLLSPAGISLEVIYLDRSEGGEVNTHPFSLLGPSIGTVRLLYRPGHYDILYKAEDEAIAKVTVPTYLQYDSHTKHTPVFNLGVPDVMTSIPGLSYASQQPSWSPRYDYSHAGFDNTHTTVALDPVHDNPAAAPNDQLQAPHASAFAEEIRPDPELYTQTSCDLVLRQGTAPNGYRFRMPARAEGPFRSSKWELRPEFVDANKIETLFRTQVMRNSHFNPAHFSNPDFQPEEWHPDEFYVVQNKRGHSPPG